MMDECMEQLEKRRRQEEQWAREFHRSRGEELANALSHLAGTVFSIVALTMMCVYAAFFGTARHIASCAVFGATLVILYNCSTLYHLAKNHRIKSIFQVLDHVSIYLLIAGTYTPFALGALGGRQGWTLLVLVWGLALVGILGETVLTRLKCLSLPIYLLMGWLALFFIRPLLQSLSTTGAVMLITGGVVYTLGVIFYVLDKVPYMHTIWHFFVLGGSVCHWVAVNFTIIPS